MGFPLLFLADIAESLRDSEPRRQQSGEVLMTSATEGITKA